MREIRVAMLRHSIQGNLWSNGSRESPVKSKYRIGVSTGTFYTEPLKGSEMRRFKWIEWNLQKIEVHGLSAEDVEAAFDSVFEFTERKDGSFQMFAATPSGRRIWVIWRYDREDGEIPDVFGDLDEAPIFVITAY